MGYERQGGIEGGFWVLACMVEEWRIELPFTEMRHGVVQQIGG